MREKKKQPRPPSFLFRTAVRIVGGEKKGGKEEREFGKGKKRLPIRTVISSFYSTAPCAPLVGRGKGKKRKKEKGGEGTCLQERKERVNRDHMLYVFLGRGLRE